LGTVPPSPFLITCASGSVLEARATNSFRSCFFSCCRRSTSRTAASSRLARCLAARRRAAPCRWALVSFSSPSAFSRRTCSRANSRWASSFSLRRKLLPAALALILVPSSVTRSSLISPSALSMPSTCTNKSSKAALFSERKPDSVRWLIAPRPHSHCNPGSYSHCRATSRAELMPPLVNQLVTSSNTYGFALSDTANTAGGPVKLTNDPISNLDNRPDDRYGNGKTATDLPSKGVADQVTIDPKTAYFRDSQGRSVSLSSLAFHELAEAYAKIDGGKAYGDFQTINVVN